MERRRIIILLYLHKIYPNKRICNKKKTKTIHYLPVSQYTKNSSKDKIKFPRHLQTLSSLKRKTRSYNAFDAFRRLLNKRNIKRFDEGLILRS